MTEQSSLFAVKPIIKYPREAQVGKTYLMTIDLQPEEGFEWQYEEEEYPVYCKVDSDLFSSKPVGEPTIILHRFGGSYGEARFLLTAKLEELFGKIKVTLVNKWGISIKQLTLENIRVVQFLLSSSVTENSTDFWALETRLEEQKREEAEVDILVREVRARTKPVIQNRCGTIRVLDMEQPISLNSIYTKVNVLEKVTRNQRRTIEELLEESRLEELDRFSLSHVQQQRVSGLDLAQNHDKLMILGKPGIGKTTFLKWLAIQCNEGQVHPERVPIFVTLNEFAEAPGQPNLQNFISSQFRNCGIDDADRVAEILLQTGRTLVLLDGLDAVRDVDHNRVLQEVLYISTHFAASQFVVTCRIAAQEYTFQQFTEVEVADFDDEQITEFSYKWFYGKDPVKAKRFLEELETRVPLKELATVPLLLILLCLVFEERGEFPVSRAELYQEGLNILLKTWDAKRSIMRDEVYRALSLKRKEDLLSQIALATFERGEYFFKQKTLEEQISNYIRSLPASSNSIDTLRLDSEVILKAIEAQHGLLVERARGIYTFSHLTFHEYFTAMEIVSRDRLEILVQRIHERRWREVFLLTCAMLSSADNFLISIKTHIDQIWVEDSDLRDFLQWLNMKVISTKTQYKPSAVRALYFAHTLNFSSEFIKSIDNSIPLESILIKYPSLGFEYAQPQNEELRHSSEIACDMTLNQAFLSDLPTYIDYSLDYELAVELGLINQDEKNVDRNYVVYCACVLALELILARASNLHQANDVEFQRKLQDLRRELPLSFNAPEQWWNSERSTWLQKLREIMIEHRNIGHEWRFSSEQRKKLQQYYDASKLLIDCLNSDCYVSREVRQEIEESTLIPFRT